MVKQEEEGGSRREAEGEKTEGEKAEGEAEARGSWSRQREEIEHLRVDIGGWLR